MTIDTLFENAVFHTCVQQQETYTYLGVRGDRIVWLGNEAPTEAKIKKRVDLGGAHVFPALTDSHMHLLFTVVQAASDAQICTVGEQGVQPNTMAGVEQRMRAIAAKTPKGQIIAATNYIPSAIDQKRLPNRFELDAWTDGAPVVIYCIDGHSAALSTEMLKKIGIDPEQHDGILTGWEHESMQGKITDAIASGVGLGTLARGVANFLNDCARFGVARVCALDGAAGVTKDPLMKLLVLLARRMPIGVRLYPEYFDLKRAEPLTKIMKKPRVGGCGEWEMDGSVGSHSAAFSEPYLDTGETAPCYYDADKVAQTVREADARGWQLAVHAIGDRAIETVQTPLESLQNGRLHRIEHYEFPTRDQVERLKQHKDTIAISVQPGYAWVDVRYLKSYEHFLRPEVIARQVPLAELVRAGVTVCGSSDSPVQSMDPYAQMLGMVDFTIPEQSLSNYEAICAYCKAPAKVLGEEAEWGTLEIGKQADFFAAERDLTICGPTELAQTRAQALYIGGKRFKQRKGTALELIGMLLRRPKKI